MQIAAIKIAQKQAELSDQEYRQLLFNVAGARSSKELDEDGRRRVMAALQRQVNAARPAIQPKTPQQRKIWALWYDLKPRLPGREQNTSYLLGICRIAAGVNKLADLADLDKQQAHKAIEALKLRLDAEISKDVPF